MYKYRALGCGVVFLCTLLMSGCGAPTPEAAALEQLSGLDSPVAVSYRVVAVRETSTGNFLVLLPDKLPREDEHPKLAYSYVQPTRFGWQAINNGSIYEEPLVDNRIITGQRTVKPPLNDMRQKIIDTGLDPFVIGRSDDLNPSVTTVEVEFDDGRTLHDQVDNDVYALVNPKADMPCKIRFLNVEGQVVEEASLEVSLSSTTCN